MLPGEVGHGEHSEAPGLAPGSTRAGGGGGRAQSQQDSATHTGDGWTRPPQTPHSTPARPRSRTAGGFVHVTGLGERTRRRRLLGAVGTAGPPAGDGLCVHPGTAPLEAPEPHEPSGAWFCRAIRGPRKPFTAPESHLWPLKASRGPRCGQRALSKVGCVASLLESLPRATPTGPTPAPLRGDTVAL